MFLLFALPAAMLIPLALPRPMSPLDTATSPAPLLQQLALDAGPYTAPALVPPLPARSWSLLPQTPAVNSLIVESGLGAEYLQ